MILTDILIQTISGVTINLPYFLLVIWAIKTISKEMPKWISEYFRLRENELRLRWAKGEIKDLR
jgi:hypothetical protein